MKPDKGRCSRPANPPAAALVDTARGSDATELADVAAATFPLACPPSAAAEDVAAFIAAHLSSQRFGDYLADPDRRLLVARRDGRIVGYTMLIRGTDPETVELSKMYVLPDLHRTGAASALMEAGLAWAAGQGARSVWLGVNRNNHRAQRFYAKHGFEATGTRTFQLGSSLEHDAVMTRTLP